VQRPAHLLVGALAIHRVGVFARARVDEDDRVQPRPDLVVGVDAREIGLDQPARRHATRGHRALQIDDRLLVDFEVLDRRRWRLRLGRRALGINASEARYDHRTTE
jgi:hypothetical protein